MYRFKDLRIDNDLTQIQIAKMLNISQRKYSYIETGISDISPEILIDLAKIYNVSIDYILGITNIAKPYPRIERERK